MASSDLLRLAILIAFLTISAAGRPCKTLLIFSSSFTVNPQNPNPNDSDFSSTRYVTVFTVRRFNPYYIRPFFINRRRFPVVDGVDRPQIQRSQSSVPLISDNLDSFRDRTRDILSVVVALLFGAGCGALTAATMYLVWALIANRHSYHFDDDYESDGYEDSSPKKIGYVKVPDSAAVKEAA